MMRALILTAVNIIKIYVGEKNYYFALGAGSIGSFILAFHFSNLFLISYFIINAFLLFGVFLIENR